MFVIVSHESLVGGCLPRARPQLNWPRRSLDQVDLQLVLFPQASHRTLIVESTEAHLERVNFFDIKTKKFTLFSCPLKEGELKDKIVQLSFFIG
ncbi:hypothetical protein HLI_02595 [Halobacillus litoralis]|uniref:Uncharacterized protein n=1 Tax=Halobacillus litoralis TaxID=45668 RepID=A0A410M8Z5_9BACI|nr:hypothetical protein HLI_02595 [Halobacillus litoralis]